MFGELKALPAELAESAKRMIYFPLCASASAVDLFDLRIEQIYREMLAPEHFFESCFRLPSFQNGGTVRFILGKTLFQNSPKS